MANTTKDRMVNRIRMLVSRRDMLELLAEESSELAKAALKLIRTLGTTNPTPVTYEQAVEDLIEEANDVSLVMEVLDIDNDERQQMTKLTRWLDRVGDKRGTKS